MKKRTLHKIVKESTAAYKTTDTPLDLVALTRDGICKQALTGLAKELGLSIKELANLLPVTMRTIQRKNPDSPLSTPVSERIILISKLTDQGKEVFGDVELFKKWVRKENAALAGYQPLHLLDTAVGIQMVEDVLGRISYGVYS